VLLGDPLPGYHLGGLNITCGSVVD